MIGLIGIPVYMRHGASKGCEAANSNLSLLVSSVKREHDKSEPVCVKVVITNTLSRQIIIHPPSDFGLAERSGEKGFYICDDNLRIKCNGHFISNRSFICGLAILLRPQEKWTEEIELPVEVDLPPGPHSILYELRIPFYGNEEQFGFRPGQTIEFDLTKAPVERRAIDYWRDCWHNFINGNGVFTVKGKLEFAVK